MRVRLRPLVDKCQFQALLEMVSLVDKAQIADLITQSAEESKLWVVKYLNSSFILKASEANNE